MKRINILIAIISVVLFLDCSNSEKSSFKEKAKNYVDSLVANSKKEPIGPGNTLMRTMEFIETKYADENICVLNYSMIYDNSTHVMENIFIRNSNKCYWYSHFTDTCFSNDKLKGVPVVEALNLKSHDAISVLMSLEGKREIPIR